VAIKTDSVLDYPVDRTPEPEELIAAAMRWHFSPGTGSPFWLERARTLDFDPRRDVHTLADLTMFPNVVNELRDVRVEDLVPRGYGSDPGLVGVFESGGTTGAPKRVILLADWMERFVAWCLRAADERGRPRGVNWLAQVPTGPHLFGLLAMTQARRRGGIAFTIDVDPRWVKKSISAGRMDEIERYSDHLIAQTESVLETQDVRVFVTTPPLLARLARSDKLVGLVEEKIDLIMWGGTHMDADTRHLLQTEVFPGVAFEGGYGSTMILGSAIQREDPTGAGPCIFDTFSPYITFSVVDPETGRVVDHGQRGQVVMNHISKSMFLPNNLERDMATRIESPPGRLGDSVADVTPVVTFQDEKVVEGVY
jgi:phenylacetate-coenzyme A ligase PaaK-like adenylate-forming protein